MGFNKRRMESERAAVAAKEAEARRALGPQILADAERLVVTWNRRQERHMPMLFSPTIGAATAAGFWFLWVRCPACRTTQSVDLRMLDRHRDTAVTSLIPALSCRSCRPNAPDLDGICVRAEHGDLLRRQSAVPQRGIRGERRQPAADDGTPRSRFHRYFTEPARRP